MLLEQELQEITERALALTKPKEPMLNNLAKKLITKDLRTLIKAGFMDEELNLTPEGKSEVWALLFETFKKDLVKSAEEKLAE